MHSVVDYPQRAVSTCAVSSPLVGKSLDVIAALSNTKKVFMIEAFVILRLTVDVQSILCQMEAGKHKLNMDLRSHMIVESGDGASYRWKRLPTLIIHKAFTNVSKLGYIHTSQSPRSKRGKCPMILTFGISDCHETTLMSSLIIYT